MKKIKGFRGLLLGILTLFIFQLFSWVPQLTESFYTNFVYKFVRWVYAHSLIISPIPLIYLFFLVLIFIIIRFFVRRKSKLNLKSLSIALFNLLGWLIFLFYWLWAFNYARSDFYSRIDLKINTPDSTFLYQELVLVDSILASVRSQISEVDTIELSSDLSTKKLHDFIFESQQKVLKEIGQSGFGKVKIRTLKPKGILLRIKTAGVYLPFALEGHIDGGMHIIERPFVLAHEMAHANAFTDEGVCNLIGFLSCVNSENLFVQYSGWLEYHGYIYRALRRNNPNLLKENEYKRPNYILADLRAIVRELNKYPDIFPRFRDLFYDNYLKAQGVKAGLNSYSQMIQLCYAYKRTKGGFIFNELISEIN